MVEYTLEHSGEAQRLERQARQAGYSLEQEIGSLIPKLSPGTKILDAGCGSGLLSRYLCEQITDDTIRLEACDRSEIRLEQARNLSSKAPYDRIRYFSEDLENPGSGDNGYDQIFCRFVLQHLKPPGKSCARNVQPAETWRRTLHH